MPKFPVMETVLYKFYIVFTRHIRLKLRDLTVHLSALSNALGFWEKTGFCC